MNKCLNCGIETTNPLYCSIQCGKSYERKFHPRRKGKYYNCNNCGKEIYRQKSDTIRKNNYCSKKCYNEIRKKDKTSTSNYGNFKRINKICKECNKEFVVRDCNKNRNFCSINCKFKHYRENPTVTSNWKGGVSSENIIKSCKYCGNNFKINKYRTNANYCSVKCYMNDPLSPNRAFGDENPMANPKHRETLRNCMINYLKKTNSKGYKFMFGKNETKILDEVEKENNIKIIRHYIIGGYVVDGYCKELNIVFEVDEKYHIYCIEKDMKRQKYIEEKINCKFIRINDKGDGTYDNVSITA